MATYRLQLNGEFTLLDAAGIVQYLDRLGVSDCYISQDGRIKMYVTDRVLQFRRNHPELFASGAYVPLKAGGERTRHVIAFARRAGPYCVIITAGRFFTKLEKSADWFPAGAAGSDTRVRLPSDFGPRRYVDLFTGCAIDVRAEEGTAQRSMDEGFARMSISMLAPSD